MVVGMIMRMRMLTMTITLSSTADRNQLTHFIGKETSSVKKSG